MRGERRTGLRPAPTNFTKFLLLRPPPALRFTFSELARIGRLAIERAHPHPGSSNSRAADFVRTGASQTRPPRRAFRVTILVGSSPHFRAGGDVFGEGAEDGFAV